MASEKEILVKIRSILDASGFKDLQEESKKTNTAIDGLVGQFKGLLPALSVGAVVVAMKQMSQSALEYADNVDKVTDITGASAKQASEWVVQANHVGLSADTVANGMAILARNVVNNTDAFTKFGINVRDANGNLLPLDNILGKVRDKEKELGEGARATAMEMSLFGKSGKELHDFLTADNEEMKKVVETATRMGLVLSNLEKDKLEQTNRKLNDMKLISASLGAQINEQLIPYYIKLQETFLGLTQIIDRMSDKKKAENDSWRIAYEQTLKQAVAERERGEISERALQSTINLIKEKNLFTEQEIQEMTKTVKVDREKTDAEIKHEKELAKVRKENADKASADSKEGADRRVSIAEKTAKSLGKTEVEILKAKKDALEEALLNEDLKGKERIAIKQKIKEAELEINAELKKDAKDTAKTMAEAFVESATTVRFDWATTVQKIATSLLSEGLQPIASGLQSALGQFGSFAGVLAGGMGGFIGSLVGGFLSLFGGHSKSVAEYSEEAFKEMTDKTQDALDEISGKRTELKTAVGILEGMDIAPGAKISGQMAGIDQLERITGTKLGGLTKEQAMARILSVMGSAPSEFDYLKGERATKQTETGELTRLKSLLTKAGSPVETMSQAEVDEFGVLAKRYLGLDVNTFNYKTVGGQSWAYTGKIEGETDARQRRIAEINKEINQSELDALKDQLDIREKLQKLESAPAEEARLEKLKQEEATAKALKEAYSAEIASAQFEYNMGRTDKGGLLSSLQGIAGRYSGIYGSTEGRSLALTIKQLQDDLAEIVPQAQTGGYVQKGGLVNVHAGEKIVPANQAGGISIVIGEGAFQISGVNWANEGEKQKVAKDIAGYMLGYVRGGIKTPSGTARRL